MKNNSLRDKGNSLLPAVWLVAPMCSLLGCDPIVTPAPRATLGHRVVATATDPIPTTPGPRAPLAPSAPKFSASDRPAATEMPVIATSASTPTAVVSATPAPPSETIPQDLSLVEAAALNRVLQAVADRGDEARRLLQALGVSQKLLETLPADTGDNPGIWFESVPERIRRNIDPDPDEESVVVVGVGGQNSAHMIVLAFYDPTPTGLMRLAVHTHHSGGCGRGPGGDGDKVSFERIHDATYDDVRLDWSAYCHLGGGAPITGEAGVQLLTLGRGRLDLVLDWHHPFGEPGPELESTGPFPKEVRETQVRVSDGAVQILRRFHFDPKTWTYR